MLAPLGDSLVEIYSHPIVEVCSLGASDLKNGPTQINDSVRRQRVAKTFLDTRATDNEWDMDVLFVP